MNVCNFRQGDPALFSLRRTHLFHEVGVTLHHMLSDVTYPSDSGTSVTRICGLPTNYYVAIWLEVPEVLAEFATPWPKPARRCSPHGPGYWGCTSILGRQLEYVPRAGDLPFTEAPARGPMARQGRVLAELGIPRLL